MLNIFKINRNKSGKIKDVYKDKFIDIINHIRIGHAHEVNLWILNYT